jgi:hypothetical protein
MLEDGNKYQSVGLTLWYYSEETLNSLTLVVWVRETFPPLVLLMSVSLGSLKNLSKRIEKELIKNHKEKIYS